MTVIQATPSDLPLVREFFAQYAASLGIDLSFQQFEREVASLPGDYAPPSGRLLLASSEEVICGCVALRRLDGTRCEMKRLYVLPHARKTGVGRVLALSVIEAARSIGYRSMLLDTLPSMHSAIALYESLGFRDTEPYRFNPVEGTRFLELTLECTP